MKDIIYAVYNVTCNAVDSVEVSREAARETVRRYKELDKEFSVECTYKIVRYSNPEVVR